MGKFEEHTFLDVLIENSNALNSPVAKEILNKRKAFNAVRETYADLISIWKAQYSVNPRLAEMQKRVEELEGALNEIMLMKLLPNETDYKFTYNRCWHIADKALKTPTT